MAEQVDLKAILEQLPDLDPVKEEKDKDGKLKKNTRDSGKLTGPDWPTASKLFEQIFSGGRSSLIALIGMLGEGNVPEAYRPRYLMHGLALYVCRPEGRKYQGLLQEAMVSQIDGPQPTPARLFLIRELEVFGNQQAAPALGKCLLDEETGDAATRTLLAIGAGAAEQFRTALPKAAGRRRLAVLQALGVLGDAQSASAFKAAAGDSDREVRLIGLWSLANLGDASAADLLIKASNSEGWERIEATKCCLLLAEKLLANGHKPAAARIYKHLRDSRTDEKEQYVRDAAIRGLKTTE